MPKTPPRNLLADPALAWQLPLGLAGLIVLLAVRFVGGQPFGLDNDNSAQVVEFGLAAGVFALIAWGIKLSQLGRATEHQVLRDRLLVVLGFGGFLAYFNFGHLHFHNLVHVWDTYHYHVGAKYFPELNYERLYDCSEVVGVESGRKAEVEKRTITDLRTNLIVKTDDLIANPEEHCKRFFTQERWRQFSDDINTYRSWVNEQRWTDILHDHGYNATPVWTLAGMFWTNTLSAFDGLVTPDIPEWTDPKTGQKYPGSAEGVRAARSGEHHILNRYNEGLRLRGFNPPWTSYLGGRHVILLNLIDPIFWLLTCAMIWWAFGPRGFAIAAMVMGCNFPNRFYWTGGAFLRHDWIFFLVAAVCLLKKEKYALAGAAFAYTTLLRLFPGLVALGPALAAVEYVRLHRKLDPGFVRFVAAGIGTSILLVGASFFFVGNTGAASTYKATVTPDGEGTTVALSRIDSKSGQPVTWLRQPRVKATADELGLTIHAGADDAFTLAGTATKSGVLTIDIFGGEALEVPVTAGATAAQLAASVVSAVEVQAMKDRATGGVEVWQRFAANTLKHANTALTNHMGLRTFLSWRPSTIGARLFERGTIDPWAKWKATRLEKWNESKPLFVVLMLGALVLVYLAIRHTGPTLWVSASLGIGLIPFGAELTNYYYCFLMGFAVLHTLRREVGWLLAALAMVTLFINFRPLAFMSSELDEQYVAMSVASLIAVVSAWWCFTKWGAATSSPEEPPVLPETLALPTAGAVAEPKSVKRKRSK
ncbi:MAG: hypothetical protein JNG84_05960 [Archangium sp.]|nr:hypothetical protein [Archangium sp.]